DAGLQVFTESVRGKLQSETQNALAELQRSTPRMLAERADTREDRSDAGSCSVPHSSAKPRGALLSTDRSLDRYPGMEALIETDRAGCQIRKWMPRTLVTPYIDIPSEAYFTAALTQSAAPAFTFGATVAPTSGLLLGVFAVPVNEQTGELG